MDPLLSMAGIVKTFPGVQALKGVDFAVTPGQVHALMGENGAGKSTLLKVLTGVMSADGGEIRLNGSPVRPRSPQDAAQLGISAVYQEPNLAPNLSIAENICIGREPMGPLGIRWREVRRRATVALARLGLDLNVDRPIGSCSPAIQHLTAIARALDVDAKLLVLDEPTSSLDRDEAQSLFSTIKRLKDQGLGIIYVTHFLDEVYEIADAITVLRNGAKVGSSTPAELPKRDLVTLMIGRDAPGDDVLTREVAEPGDVIIEARDAGKRYAIGGLNFSVAHGEVLGLAGLLGSGRTETLRLLFSVDSPDCGNFKLDGSDVRLSPRLAIRRGLGMSPEERKSEGIFPNLSVHENMLIVAQIKRGWLRRIPRESQKKDAERMKAELRIATPDLDRPISSLSGGNQQKALLARWLISNPRLLLLDEPTRGIDVGAKFEITNLIEALRQQGMAFVLVSSELSEIVRSSTKVVILRDRRMVGEATTMTEGAILEQIAEGDT